MHQSIISLEFEARLGDGSAFFPHKSEPRPGHCVFQLKPHCDVTDFLCADPRHQSGILDRTVHIRATRNLQMNELDHFFGALTLPGILKIMGEGQRVRAKSSNVLEQGLNIGLLG